MASFKVEVYQYAAGGESAAFLFRPGPMTDGRRQALKLTWSGTVGAADEQDACEVAFETLNRDDRPTAKTSYSLSVGDVVVVNGHAYMCDVIGFTPTDFTPEGKPAEARG
jgi:hypothetical protein